MEAKTGALCQPSVADILLQGETMSLTSFNMPLGFLPHHFSIKV